MAESIDKGAKQLLTLAGLIFLLFIGFKLAKYFNDILIILGISILIAYLLIGPVDLLTRIVRFRSIAVILVYVLLFTSVVSISIFITPKIAQEFGEFTKQIPQIVKSVNTHIQTAQVYLNNTNIPVSLPSIQTEIINKFTNKTIASLSNILGVAYGTFHILFYILVTAVISYYFLLEGHHFVTTITKYMPKEYQHHITILVSRFDKCLRGFYGGMVKLAAINASVMFITYLIMGVPFALLLASWHFLSCIIPTVGGWIGLVPAMLVIAFTDPLKIWIPFVVYEGFTRLIKDNFITPKIMGDAIGIHPVVVLIAILAGLKTAGLVGVLFALPIFGVINVIIKYLFENIYKPQEA